MNVSGIHYRTIWEESESCVSIIDQRWLPHRFIIERLRTFEEFLTAIRDMHLRGAPLIGVAAAYAFYFGLLEMKSDDSISKSIDRITERIKATRPTAVNLFIALDRQKQAVKNSDSIMEMQVVALSTARLIADEDVEFCKRIGQNGLELLRSISMLKNGATINILTHCNAGWLAAVDWGTALAPVYAAFREGLSVHVWVDETRPRNQGAKLTAWELKSEGVPHTLIADNTGGHLMQHGFVDVVIVGSDRTTVQGDVANKIGTYLKALAAMDNGIPFYVALPSTSIDFTLNDGVKEIEIEQRSGAEVLIVDGLYNGNVVEVSIAPEGTKAANYAFDVTPARLVTGLITEKGICRADIQSILRMHSSLPVD